MQPKGLKKAATAAEVLEHLYGACGDMQASPHAQSLTPAVTADIVYNICALFSNECNWLCYCYGDVLVFGFV